MKILTIILALILFTPLILAINSGDKIIAGDKTITLLSIANDRVRISVDGQTDVIQQYHQKEINGVSIYVRKIISVTSPNDGKSSAELIIGTDAKTELIYIPYKEPKMQKTEITQNQPTKQPSTKSVEQPVGTEQLKVQEPLQQPQIQPKQPENQQQKHQIFNIIDFLKSIADKLRFY